MQAAGQSDGNYTLCGEEVEMHNGIVRTASGGLEGSTLSVDAAVRNMVGFTKIAPEEAIHMASLHPARLPGIDHRPGTLNVGKCASIIVLNNELQLQQIWMQGQAFPPVTFHFSFILAFGYYLQGLSFRLRKTQYVLRYNYSL